MLLASRAALPHVTQVFSDMAATCLVSLQTRNGVLLRTVTLSDDWVEIKGERKGEARNTSICDQSSSFNDFSLGSVCLFFLM